MLARKCSAVVRATLFRCRRIRQKDRVGVDGGVALFMKATTLLLSVAAQVRARLFPE